MKGINSLYKIWIAEGRHNSFESLLKKLDIKELNQCFRNDIESKGKQELLSNLRN